MALLTTTIGAYPKPACRPAFDWFQAADGPDTAHPTAHYATAIAEMGDGAEALFAQRVADALDYGLADLERCFDGCPKDVTRAAHMCCGYPDAVDVADYPKAPKSSYFELAEVIDASAVQAVSVEDAHRPNDLGLLDMFKRTTVIFGVVAIAKSRVESIDEIKDRLMAALGHIDAERLVAAPDCCLGLLGRDLARAKLRNLALAAHAVG